MAYVPNPEIFVKAAAHIERTGLHRGYYYPMPDDYSSPVEREPSSAFENTPMDVVGAIAYTSKGHPVPGARWFETIAGKAVAWAEIYADIHDLVDREISIPAWCDRTTRTKEEAVALLKALAEGAQRAREEKS